MGISRTVASGLLLALAACDCGSAPPAPSEPTTGHGGEFATSTDDVAAPDRAAIAPSRRTIGEDAEHRYELLRFRFTLADTRIGVRDLAFSETLHDALLEDDAVLAINGGYWDLEREPEGITIVQGVELAPFSSSLGGGVLIVDDGLGRILDAEAEELAVPSDADFAQQCMPRIVVDGALNIRRDDGRRADRTALCLRDEGRTLDVYVARGEDPTGHGGPTLYAFGELLVAEGCEAALNLDGGSSTGAVYRGPSGVTRLAPRVALKLALTFR